MSVRGDVLPSNWEEQKERCCKSYKLKFVSLTYDDDDDDDMNITLSMLMRLMMVKGY